MKAKKILASFLAVALAGSLAACSSGAGRASELESGAAETASSAAESAGGGAESSGTEETKKKADPDTPLVVGYSNFSSKFSPFFASSAYDQDAQGMTQLALLPSDRTGAIVYKGIEGETIPYNGTDYTYYGPADLEVTENEDGSVYYDFTLRDDLVFSDGEPVTIDDVIFSMYVLCDPSYDGSTTLFSQPIEGLADYRGGMDTLLNLLVAAGRDNTDFSRWDEATQKEFWEAIDTAGVAMAEEICEYLKSVGYNEEADTIAACAANWGYTLADDATAADFWAAIMEAYPDVLSAIETEMAESGIDELMPGYEKYLKGVKTGESADSISGIQKVDDYHLRVVAEKVDATMIYQLGVSIAPLHYYGDPEQYDYENNKFGFPKGDLSIVRAKTTEPMGAGPYIFKGFENGVISYEANPNYFKGEPKTKYINFLESNDADKMNGVVTGTIDITDPSFSNEVADSIAQTNGGELTGPVITTSLVDNLGYGYIGINSKNVCVGGEAGSDASKNLRKAFGTIFSVYRDVAIASYYGDRASVINYPISNTSWAAPQPTDDGYRIAFSVDAGGNELYTSGMSDEEKYEAAKQGALSFFEMAGYEVDNGKVVKAPAGASMEYEVLIPADGSGDHPSFMILKLAKEALAEIGINLIVTDLSNSADLWDSLDAGTVEMWCAAWGATVDPDMYQIYYSDADNNFAEPGGSWNYYQISDPELDKLILDARASTDQAYRKAMYKACLDIIVDWADEIPVYQRQNAIIFSTERVNIDTVTPDITTFYGWMSEIENVELN
ncbi:MAG: ABC transporter substrate-binding protein [Lachnospiraceae bacterium]|nr:ABC transporter substrate-binding protein [Lachnospiraceae bacterium]